MQDLLWWRRRFRLRSWILSRHLSVRPTPALLKVGVHVAERCELAEELGGASGGAHFAPRVEIPSAE
jgi:hypothetical protein